MKLAAAAILNFFLVSILVTGPIYRKHFHEPYIV